jgi:hypothetical protein
VTRRRALALAAALAGCAGAASRAAAQVLPAQPARYLLTTEAADARALWVNPAGLARHLEASLGGDVALDRFRAGGMQISQYSANLSSRSVAVAWVHERYPAGQSLNAYAVGAGLGDEQFSAGATRRWYRGLVSGAAWDVAARVATGTGQEVQLSLVARNLGSPTLTSPTLGDSTYWATLVPGASLALFDGSVQVGAEWEVAMHHWSSQEIRAGGTVALGKGLALVMRADLTADFRRRGFTVALTWDGPQARASAFAGLPGRANQVDAFGASGALVAREPRRAR